MSLKSILASFFLGSAPPRTADLVEDTVRGVGTWIDERTFTDEEKSKANLEVAVEYAKFVGETLEENTIRSQTRRSIAIWIIRVEAFMLTASVITFPISQAWSEYLYKIAVDSPWGLLTLGVGAFFFGTHLVRAIR